MPTEFDAADLVHAWWKYQQLAGGRADRKARDMGEPPDAVAAVRVVDERVGRRGVEALALASALVDATETDDLLRVGAGPLEDLLVTWRPQVLTGPSCHAKVPQSTLDGRTGTSCHRFREIRLALHPSLGGGPMPTGSHHCRIALAGYGYWGCKHVRVLSSIPDVAVTAEEAHPDRLVQAAAHHPATARLEPRRGDRQRGRRRRRPSR